MPKDSAEPRTFFLNEQHELAPGEPKGGGGHTKFGDIDWDQRGRRIADSLLRAVSKVRKSPDPLREERYFLAAVPAKIPKLTTSKQHSKTGKPVQIEDTPSFGGKDSLVFRRLGLDLLQVHPDGTATVHVGSPSVDRLVSTSRNLGDESSRQQTRLSSIDSFTELPWHRRMDSAWLSEIESMPLVDFVVEFQPVLSRREVRVLIRTLTSQLDGDHGESISRAGTDFSGRSWVRGQARPSTLRRFAERYQSIQSIHPPLWTDLAATKRGNPPRAASQKVSAKVDPKSLPAVAVVDAGVPDQHVSLERYKRGKYAQPGLPRYLGTHGTFVASRVVFGDPESPDEIPSPQCSFYDVMLAEEANRIDDKSVGAALNAVIGNAPDVRVFNMSFDQRPLPSMNEVERRERLALVQDLDNQIFARDILVVVAAGNSPAGISPRNEYPDHFNETAWKLGPWASGLNTLTCGSYIARPNPDGMVGEVGLPSPFTRSGPGAADAPVPEFSASGGECDRLWKCGPGMGVFCLNNDGQWEDRCGTSYAAPLLAREAAIAFALLQNACPPETRPFAVTVKAFLALTASVVGSPPVRQKWVRQTLGRGRARADRLANPLPDSATFLWQTMLEGPKTIARVNVPVPDAWLHVADAPRLRLVCAWDPPVNATVSDIWCCRKVNVKLRCGADGSALTGKGKGHKSYPLVDRVYDLSAGDGSDWIVEVSYDQTAEYAMGIDFSPQQRVALAIELLDAGDAGESPQGHVQALPIASTLVRLAIPPVGIGVPVMIRPRI